MSEFVNSDGSPWVPAFRGQRPPFQPGHDLGAKPGNDLAVTHGAYSNALLAPIAERIAEQILSDDDVAYLRMPRFEQALERYSFSAARVIRLEAWIANMSEADAARSDRGQTSPLELLRKWKTTADNEAGRLGLDAVSWARIRKDYAIGSQVSVAGELSRLRAQHEAAVAEADGD